MFIKEYFRTAFRKDGDIEEYAYTKGLSKEELTSLFNSATYKWPKRQCEKFPVSLNFYKFSNNHFCVSRIVHSKFDIDNRTGNFFAHSILITKEELAGINNNIFLLFNKKGLFLENLTSFEECFKGEKPKRLKPRNVNITLNDDYSKILNLKTIQENYDTKNHIISIISFLRSLDSVQKTLIVVADNDIKDKFMEALLFCLPTNNRCLVTFTTYLKIKKIGPRTKDLYRVIFTMDKGKSDFGFTREDYENYLIFNFVDNEFSDYPNRKIKYYARYISEFIWDESIDDVQKTNEIRNFVETVPRFKGDLVEVYCSFKYYFYLHEKTNDKSNITEIVNNLIEIIQVPEGDEIFFKNIFTFILCEVISLGQLKNYIARICEHIDKRNDEPIKLEVLSGFYSGLVISGVKERKDALNTIFESYEQSAAKYREYFEGNDIRRIFLKYNLNEFYIQDINNYLLSIGNKGNDDFEKIVKEILTKDSLINSITNTSNKEVKDFDDKKTEMSLLIDTVKTISGFKSPSLGTFIEIRKKLINKRDQFEANSTLANKVKMIDKQILNMLSKDFSQRYNFDKLYNLIDKIKDDFDKSDSFVKDILLLKEVFKVNEMFFKGEAIEKRDLRFIQEQMESISGVSYIRFSKNIKKVFSSIKNNRVQAEQTIAIFAEIFLENSNANSINESILIDIISSLPVKEKYYYFAYLTYSIMMRRINVNTFEAIIQELIFQVDIDGYKNHYIKEVKKLMKKDYTKEYDEPELFRTWDKFVNPKMTKLAQKWRQAVHGK